MASINELNRHLKSVETVADVTKAMRAISSAKYAKMCDQQKNYQLYAFENKKIVEKLPFEAFSSFTCKNEDAPVVYLLIGGNRDFCGGYLTELYRYAFSVLPQDPQSYQLCVVGKRTIEYCKEHEISVQEGYALSDTPSFQECSDLLDQLLHRYFSGEISGIHVIFQKVKNVMIQIPTEEILLPLEQMVGQQREDVSCIPDLPTVADQLMSRYVRVEIYARILEAAVGIQAATMVAMRSANENACDSADNLKLAISRKRQAMVTSSVIEIASGTAREEDENGTK